MKMIPGEPLAEVVERVHQKFWAAHDKANKTPAPVGMGTLSRWYELLCLARNNPNSQSCQAGLLTVLREMQNAMWDTK
jgi:hypothetical protein